MKKTVLVMMALAGAVLGLFSTADRRLVAQAALTPEQTLDRRAIGDRAAGDLLFSPDGSRVIFTAAEPVKGTTRARAIWMLDVASGQLRQLTYSDKSDSSPRWSPDGDSIAFVSDRDGSRQLYRLSLRGGEAQKLTDRKEDVELFRWSRDGARIALLMQEPKPEALQNRERDKDDTRVVDKENRRARVWVLDVASKALKQITTGPWKVDGITWTPDDRRLITSATAHPEVDQWNERIYAIAVAAPELVKYKSADGVEIEAAFLKPSALSSKPYPAVILVHGGPTGRWSDTFEPWGQLLAARGYAVLYPNVRGSTGYGQRFVEMNRADWGGGDFRDVMAGADWLVARGIADPNRLGIGGWSYGGYMAAWAVTQTNRFKAAVSGAPVIDMASEFGTENGSAYDEWFYRGLKRYGVESDLVLYPREPHGLREEKHLLDRLNRVIAWYDAHLKPAAPATAGKP